MKNKHLINAHLSALVSRVGHSDAITICDAGLPIYNGPERIDLAVERGVPDFLTVLTAMASELEIERLVIAEEMQKVSPAFYKSFMAAVDTIGKRQKTPIKIDTVTHEEFKVHTKTSRAVVRTGECTPYANVIIYSGVAF